MKNIAHSTFVDAPAPDLEALLAAHDTWDRAGNVSLPALKIGSLEIYPEAHEQLVAGLGTVSYGLTGDHNRQYLYPKTPDEQNEITKRNQGLDNCLPAINQLSRLFLDLAQQDAEELRHGHILGWDLEVRGGRYDESARQVSNELHIDGGPPTLRYISGLIGATTGFANQLTINKADINELGQLYKSTADITYADSGDMYRFCGLTSHIGPPFDDRPRLSFSATAWLYC